MRLAADVRGPGLAAGLIRAVRGGVMNAFELVTQALPPGSFRELPKQLVLTALTRTAGLRTASARRLRRWRSGSRRAGRRSVSSGRLGIHDGYLIQPIDPSSTTSNANGLGSCTGIS
jgi:hypothetical protein